MPDARISELAELTALAADDEFVVVDKSDTQMAPSGTNKRVKRSTLDALYPQRALDETITGDWKIADGSRLEFGTGVLPDGSKGSLYGSGSGIETNNSFTLRMDTSPTSAPELFYRAANGGWGSGIDVSAAQPGRDFVVAFKIDYPEPGNVNDLIYLSHNGPADPTVGIGKSQPESAYRCWVIGAHVTEEPDMGTLNVQAGNGAVAHILNLMDFSGTDQIWVDPVATGRWKLVMRNPAGMFSPAIQLVDTADNSVELEISSGTGSGGGGQLRFGADPNACLYRQQPGVLAVSNAFAATGYISAGRDAFLLNYNGIPQWNAAANAQTTVGAAGGAAPLPATPTEYLKVMDSSGNVLVIPAFAAA
ncbi:hypothetical protein AAW14_31975 [Streptomyces hygroscopicus]|uniref:hypothetical protein n=1 Tax=Streptomyces hygroscopicus TaxID=1912 RepID=UPI00223EBB2E|nr:hypothetical protein [Streptomyces hygroscopicus]MCW7946484.1 hypothetical protein [Streptomyces hygroscopicus]